jgi:CheY-like chemotaxis protein
VRGPSGSALRLLLVDDEDFFVELVEALVAPEERIQIVGRARTGREAVALASASAPDVIVMDIGMPVMDGIEATRRIRKADQNVGIVIFTGSDEARDELRAREVGADAFVQKPHISALLTDAILRAAKQSAARRMPSRGRHTLEAAIALP